MIYSTHSKNVKNNEKKCVISIKLQGRNYRVGRVGNRVRPRFFDQVGHETMYASSGNKGFPNEPDVGYRNFFIPRVEKTSKN